jgi:hypothetical protein
MARRWSVIDGIIPQDDEYRRYMDVAEKLDGDTYNEIGEIVHTVLKGTHATETDYLASIGKLYIKLRRE